MELLKDKKFLLIACATCAYAVECVVENETTKHVVASFLCAGCAIYGGQLAYSEACKASSGIQLAMKKGAKAVREKVADELTKRPS